MSAIGNVIKDLENIIFASFWIIMGISEMSLSTKKVSFQVSLHQIRLPLHVKNQIDPFHDQRVRLT